jgi:uncharacterized protein
MTELTLEMPGDHLFIRATGPQGIRIGDRHFSGSLILGRQTLIESWDPLSVEDLQDQHFTAVLDLQPEVVLLGTGAKQKMLHPQRLARFHRAGVGIEVMSTEAACRTFNVLAAEDRQVVAALLPLHS